VTSFWRQTAKEYWASAVIIGYYQFDKPLQSQTRHIADQLSGYPWRSGNFPVPEGLRTTVVSVQEGCFQNLNPRLERRLLDPKLPPPTTPESKTARGPRRLDGVPGRIPIHSRSQETGILYGPPGTRQTYWAHRTARRSCGPYHFGHLYDELQTDRPGCSFPATTTQRGLVRFTTSTRPTVTRTSSEGLSPIPQVQPATYSLLLPNGIFKQVCQRRQRTTCPKLSISSLMRSNRGDIPRNLWRAV